jgi:hypothetical protein
MDVAGHFQAEEIKQMDQFQGGSDTEKYGAPYYGKLWEMIESDPTIKEKISLAVQGLMNLPEQEAMEKKKILEQENQKRFGQPEGQVPPPEFPIEQELAAKGEDGDTEIAFMPEAMMSFMWDLYPPEIPVEERLNEETGLPEFWFWDTILPILGGILGQIFIPIPGFGAAIGSGLGSVGASTIHNLTTDDPAQKRDLWDIGGRALMSGALGYVGGSGIEAGAAKGWGAGLEAAKTAATSWPALLAGGAGALGTGYSNHLKSQAKAQTVQEQNEKRINDYNDYIKSTREEEKKRVDEKNAEDRKYREIENQRIDNHLKQVEANRQQDIANEKAYQDQRNQQIKEYYAMYYPNISMNGIKDVINKRGVV